MLNDYVYFLQDVTGAMFYGDFISLQELGKLGCNIPPKYNTSMEITLRNCNDSSYVDWLINGQKWWLRSASSVLPNYVWTFNENGYLPSEYMEEYYGVRPTITIDKETLHYIESLKTYEIGEEISIEDEKFNVISQTATTVTMLA